MPLYVLPEKYKLLFSVENIMPPRLIRLPYSIFGMLYWSRKHRYYIYINDRLCYQQQYRVLIHELKHIECDMARNSYIVGVDMQFHKIEREAVMGGVRSFL